MANVSDRKKKQDLMLVGRVQNITVKCGKLLRTISV